MSQLSHDFYQRSMSHKMSRLPIWLEKMLCANFCPTTSYTSKCLLLLPCMILWAGSNIGDQPAEKVHHWPSISGWNESVRYVLAFLLLQTPNTQVLLWINFTYCILGELPSQGLRRNRGTEASLVVSLPLFAPGLPRLVPSWRIGGGSVSKQNSYYWRPFCLTTF